MRRPRRHAFPTAYRGLRCRQLREPYAPQGARSARAATALAHVLRAYLLQLAQSVDTQRRPGLSERSAAVCAKQGVRADDRLQGVGGLFGRHGGQDAVNNVMAAPQLLNRYRDEVLPGLRRFGLAAPVAGLARQPSDTFLRVPEVRLVRLEEAGNLSGDASRPPLRTEQRPMSTRPAQKGSTQGRTSISHDQALRGCVSRCT